MQAVSVVIPTVGRIGVLREMLYSLAVQHDAPPFEVIIVDNRGLDAVCDCVQWFCDNKKLDAVTIRACKKGNKSYAVNVGMRRALNRNVLILDDDDMVYPDYVREMGAALGMYPYVGAAMRVDALNDPRMIRRRPPMQQVRFAEYHGIPFVIGASIGIRKEAFKAIGGFDENLTAQEDIDLAIRLHDHGVTPVFVEGAILQYRYRPDLRGMFDQERAYGKGEAALYRKYHPRFGRRGMREVASTFLAIARSAGNRERALTYLGSEIGRIQGSHENGVFYV